MTVFILLCFEIPFLVHISCFLAIVAVYRRQSRGCCPQNEQSRICFLTPAQITVHMLFGCLGKRLNSLGDSLNFDFGPITNGIEDRQQWIGKDNR
jgi:hypothetical protein